MLHSWFLIEFFLKIVTIAWFFFLKLRFFITLIAFLFQIGDTKIFNDSIAKDYFFHVKVLELFDLEMVFFHYFGKYWGFIEVIEIFRYPWSENEESLGKELGEVPNGFNLIGFGTDRFWEGLVDFIDHGREEVFDDILIDVKVS